MFNANKLYYIGALGIGTFISLVLIFSQIGLISLVVRFSQAPQYIRLNSPDTEVSEKLNNILSSLGDEWLMEDIIIPIPLEDVSGRPETLTSATYGSASHEANESAFVGIWFFSYDHEESAIENYTLQKETIFFQFDESRNQDSQWKEVELPFSLFNTNESHVACRNTEKDGLVYSENCSGVFRYNQHIAYLNVHNLRDFTEYIPKENVLALIQEVDIVFSS